MNNNYRPGDRANGYILTEQWGWVPEPTRAAKAGTVANTIATLVAVAGGAVAAILAITGMLSLVEAFDTPGDADDTVAFLLMSVPTALVAGVTYLIWLGLRVAGNSLSR